MKKKSFLVGGLFGMAAGAAVVGYIKNQALGKQKEATYKYLTLFRNMNQYVVTKQRGKSIVDYLNDMGIKTAAIYGMSHMGQRVIDDLKGSDIKVLYGIDQRADRMTYEVPIYHPEDELPEVDAIIVTAFDFDEIESMLSEKMESQIIDFNDMIYQI